MYFRLLNSFRISRGARGPAVGRDLHLLVGVSFLCVLICVFSALLGILVYYFVIVINL